ncbi:MAG: prenyltransferase/squalene oxidase repeat-containing protein [Planctomycetota bacterium]
MPRSLRPGRLFACLLAVGAALAQDAPPTAPKSSPRAERRAAHAKLNPKGIAAIDAGVAWLIANQETDGHWDVARFLDGPDKPKRSPYDVGVSGLALLALLAQGDPAHGEAIARGAKWLAGKLNDKGCVSQELFDFVYTQAITTVVLAEAAARTGTAELRDAATAAVRYLESHRNPDAAWRYMPRGGEDDTSITSWCLAALRAADEAGITVAIDAVAGPLAWLESVTTPDGRTGYAKPGELSARQINDSEKYPSERSEAMTAAGLNCRLTWGTAPAAPIVRAAMGLLAAKPPVWDEPAIDFYYWYQGGTALGHLPGDADGKRWEAALQKALLAHQVTKGGPVGSWDPAGAWNHIGGRIQATAFAVLALSAPFRVGAVDLYAEMPKGPPLQRIVAMCSDGRFGAAIAALRAIDPGTLDAAQQAAVRRLQWLCSLATRRAEFLLDHAEKWLPNPSQRSAHFTAIAEGLAGTEVGNRARQLADAMDKDPKVRAEIAADRDFAAATKGYDQSKPLTQRQRALLAKIVEKYPGTEGAKNAAQLLGTRGR